MEEKRGMATVRAISSFLKADSPRSCPEASRVSLTQSTPGYPAYGMGGPDPA
jgi:hypothetical protein